MFDCFVDQDVVSAPSDLYYSLSFENENVDDKNNFYGYVDAGGNNQNDFKQFIAMRSYSDPHQVALTPIMHYLCDTFIRITFDDNRDPQVLSMDVIGEIGGSSIRSG
ncbi:MAG: hypothetical protein EZS28_019293 [Streblomastix strix]|uniref:Uncharacterized protein n=1 Tax=Streblomastix strix TaxID=222440 RepID=A0A5J4VR66_9EUKA|nr:MAG: hypothetical protein EZS28_019293 [Streblomastix strix]